MVMIVVLKVVVALVMVIVMVGLLELEMVALTRKPTGASAAVVVDTLVKVVLVALAAEARLLPVKSLLAMAVLKVGVPAAC